MRDRITIVSPVKRGSVVTQIALNHWAGWQTLSFVQREYQRTRRSTPYGETTPKETRPQTEMLELKPMSG